MNRQVTIVLLFTLLVLYFTGCQKPAEQLEENYPESTPVEVTALPGSKLYDLCPVGTVKEDSNAVESDLVIFRSRYNRPDGCALPLQNSVYQPDGEDFQNAVNATSEGSYILSYRSDAENAPPMTCIPQNSVWLKDLATESGFGNDKTYVQTYVRLDVDSSRKDREILTLRGAPKPFPAHKIGIRKAVCD